MLSLKLLVKSFILFSISTVFAAESGFARSVKKDAAPPPAQASNRVEFLEPVSGATVPEKFKVRMGVFGYKIAPLGELEKGKGHHHLVINGGPVAQGQVVPTDAKHIHFGKGQTETELTLPPGKHKLTLQFADGAHRSYGPKLSQTIEVTVSGKAVEAPAK